jgi:hypothetical protein
LIRTRTWIVILSVLAAVLAAASALLLSAGSGSRVAQLIRDGEVIEEIDLSRVASEYSFTVTSEDGGYNIVTVRPGAIRVTEADCPDKICVEMGWLSDQAAPIVCLPHRLMIRLKGSADTDAVSQ